MNLSDNKSSPDPISATAKALLLCCLGRLRGTQVARFLADQPGLIPVDGLAALEAELDARPETRALILYDHAEIALTADAANDGGKLATILDEWLTQARALLALQSRNRRRIVLVEARAAQHYADIFSGRFNLSQDCAARLAGLPRTEPDPILLSLARYCLQSNVAARRMAAELRAATTDLSNNAPDPDDALEDAVAHYARLGARLLQLETEATRLQDENAALVSARDGLLARIEDTQSDLEQQYQRRHALASSLETTTQKVEALRAKTAAKDAKIARLRRNRDSFATRLENKKHELQTILTSRSWRITAPVRRLRAAFRFKE